VRGITNEHKPERKRVRHRIRFGPARGDGLRVLEASPFRGSELSYITYHAVLTHFLFAHIIAEVCDALTLVVIALGLSERVALVVTGALQNR